MQDGVMLDKIGMTMFWYDCQWFLERIQNGETFPDFTFEMGETLHMWIRTIRTNEIIVNPPPPPLGVYHDRVIKLIAPLCKPGQEFDPLAEAIAHVWATGLEKIINGNPR